jgi:hypothetical protein
MKRKLGVTVMAFPAMTLAACTGPVSRVTTTTTESGATILQG